MKFIFFIFCLFAFTFNAQAQTAKPAPDSVAFSIIPSDTNFILRTEVYFVDEDGSSSLFSANTAPMDSATLADFIRTAEVYGGKVGEVELMGRIDVARAAQYYFATLANSTASDVLAETFANHTGQNLDDAKIEYDGLFVGDWILTSLDSGTRIDYPITITRRPNGRLVTEITDIGTGLVSRSRASIYSRDEVVLRNVADITGRLSFYRLFPGSNRLITIDRSHVLRPNRTKKSGGQ